LSGQTNPSPLPKQARAAGRAGIGASSSVMKKPTAKHISSFEVTPNLIRWSVGFL
jgi:hypothetical protein